MKKIIKNVYSSVKKAINVFVVFPLVKAVKVIICVFIAFVLGLSKATGDWADLMMEKYQFDS